MVLVSQVVLKDSHAGRDVYAALPVDPLACVERDVPHAVLAHKCHDGLDAAVHEGRGQQDQNDEEDAPGGSEVPLAILDPRILLLEIRGDLVLVDKLADLVELPRSVVEYLEEGHERETQRHRHLPVHALQGWQVPRGQAPADREDRDLHLEHVCLLEKVHKNMALADPLKLRRERIVCAVEVVVRAELPRAVQGPHQVLFDEGDHAIHGCQCLEDIGVPHPGLFCWRIHATDLSFDVSYRVSELYPRCHVATGHAVHPVLHLLPRDRPGVDVAQERLEQHERPPETEEPEQVAEAGDPAREEGRLDGLAPELPDDARLLPVAPHGLEDLREEEAVRHEVGVGGEAHHEHEVVPRGEADLPQQDDLERRAIGRESRECPLQRSPFGLH
mmetsp:Transcript_21936/g.49987  ORF Transcript_21936/g.49987 Transcript_21936/m.49987 type:complete len:388 (-) Transcript_21936:59-1222(-)